jgi:tetratricopeptide (TPR) repeat protein
MRIPRRRHEAEENLQKAIEIDPLKPDYHLELGNLYLKSGLKSKALDVYTIALRENPNSEKILEAVKSVGGAVPETADAETDGLFKKMFKEKK